MSFKKIVELSKDKETLERMNKRIKELKEGIKNMENKLTDADLYEMLRNGIEPENVKKVTDEEVDNFIEVLESVLNDSAIRCPCQNRNEIDRILAEGDEDEN